MQRWAGTLEMGVVETGLEKLRSREAVDNLMILDRHPAPLR